MMTRKNYTAKFKRQAIELAEREDEIDPVLNRRS